MQTIRNQDDLEIALKGLVMLEPRFDALREKYGTPPLRLVSASMKSLLVVVTEQFLSLSAGRAIWMRVEAELGEINAQSVLRCGQEQLVALGLSRAKAKCFHAVAEAVHKGALDLQTPQADTLRGQLLDIWGIGPWTADVYLLSAHGHGDAWPVADIALQHAVRDVFALSERPDQKRMRDMGDAWRPYRATAARLLWTHYRALKGLSPTPSQD